MAAQRQGEIYVTKRDGHRELLNIVKWQAQIAKVCKNIADVSHRILNIG